MERKLSTSIVSLLYIFVKYLLPQLVYSPLEKIRQVVYCCVYDDNISNKGVGQIKVCMTPRLTVPLFGISSAATLRNPMHRTRFLLYARKSSEAEDRQVASIDSQIAEVQKLAQRRGLTVVQTYVEARSAKCPGRPVFTEMLAQLYTGQADGIICWKLDRLARNPIDGGSLIWLLQTGTLGHIVTIEGDHSSTDNMLMLYLRFGMAGQFSLDLSKDTIRGLDNKVAQGWRPRVAPVGYINDPYGVKGEKKIHPHPIDFDKVRQLWRCLLTERPTTQDLFRLARSLGLKGYNGKPLAYGTLYRLLRCQFYTGKFLWKGQLIQGSHQPMITEAEFQAAQQILAAHTYPRSIQRKHDFKYRGMLHCGECGAYITAEKHTKRYSNGTSHDFVYYRCTKRVDPHCSQRAVRVEDLQPQMEPILAQSGIIDAMMSGGVELRLTNGTVRIVKSDQFKPFNERSPLDSGLKALASLISKVRGVFNDR